MRAAPLAEAIRKSPSSRSLQVANTIERPSGVKVGSCSKRLAIRVVHAQPYDPEARGKMERFWRTLREGCLDHVAT